MGRMMLMACSKGVQRDSPRVPCSMDTGKLMNTYVHLLPVCLTLLTCVPLLALQGSIHFRPQSSRKVSLLPHVLSELLSLPPALRHICCHVGVCWVFTGRRSYLLLLTPETHQQREKQLHFQLGIDLGAFSLMLIWRFFGEVILHTPDLTVVPSAWFPGSLIKHQAEVG